MGPLSIAVFAVFVLGAVASWVAGAVFYRRAAAQQPAGRAPGVLAATFWPFAIGRLEDRSTPEAAAVNKAVVALLICVTLAIATISFSTNINRILR